MDILMRELFEIFMRDDLLESAHSKCFTGSSLSISEERPNPPIPS